MVNGKASIIKMHPSSLIQEISSEDWDHFRKATDDDIYLILAGILSKYSKKSKISPELIKGLCGSKNKETAYKKIFIPKKRGGYRELLIPSDVIKFIQFLLLKSFNDNFSVHKCAKGFTKNESIITHAKNHNKKKVIYCIDLSGFFPSITSKRIYGMLLKYPFNLTLTGARVITNLVTYKNILPQGAPTSPFISNMICRKMDSRLYNFALKNNIYYSRYADDLCFSTTKKVFFSSIKENIKKIIDEEGFVLNELKERTLYNYNRQLVTGLVVNNKPNVTREYIRNLRAILFNVSISDWKTQNIRSTIFSDWDEYSRYYKKEISKVEYTYLMKEQGKRKLLINPNSKYMKANDIQQLKDIIKGRIEFLGQVRGKDDKYYQKFISDYNFLSAFDQDVYLLSRNFKDKLKLDESIIERQKQFNNFSLLCKEKKLNKIMDFIDKYYTNIIEYKWIDYKGNLDLQVLNDLKVISFSNVTSTKITGSFFNMFLNDHLFGGLVHSNEGNSTQILDILKASEAYFKAYKSFHLLTNNIQKTFIDFFTKYRTQLRQYPNEIPYKNERFKKENIIPFRKLTRIEDDSEALDLIIELEDYKNQLRAEYPNKIIILPNNNEKIYTDTTSVLEGLKIILRSMISNSNNTEIYIKYENPVVNDFLTEISIIIYDSDSSIAKEPELSRLFSNKLRRAVRLLRGIAEWKVIARFNDSCSYQIDVMKNKVEKIEADVSGVKHKLTFYW